LVKKTTHVWLGNKGRNPYYQGPYHVPGIVLSDFNPKSVNPHQRVKYHYFHFTKEDTEFRELK
jgi:hypothetical protein